MSGHERRNTASAPTNPPRAPCGDKSHETPPPHHPTIRERIDAAEAAADEVVADEGGQLSGEVNALAVPFEEAAAALRAAIHPGALAGGRADCDEQVT